MSIAPSNITTKIRSFVQQGDYLEALHLYTKHSPQLVGTKFTYPSLLKACNHHNHGKTIHGSIITLGFQSDPYISTSLINMYNKCGSLFDAHQVFDKVSDRTQDVTLWNSIIHGYFKYGLVYEGILHFHQMVSLGISPDAYTLNTIILGTSSCRNLFSKQGKEIHGYIVRRSMFDHGGDSFLETALVNMYMKCGRVVDACRVFDKLEDKSNKITVWNAMIGGFCENGLWEKSFEFYALLRCNEKCELGSNTLSNILTACEEDVDLGRMVHCDALKLGLEWEPYVCTSLLTMYGRFMLVEDAMRVFLHGYKGNVELWNAMISVYVSNGLVLEGLDNYYEMRLNGLKSDSFTITNVLTACSMIDYYDFGRRVHGEMIKRPMHKAAQSALLTMYAKCGYIADAELVFRTIDEKDEITWGSMMSGFCQNGKYEECLGMFKAMKVKGVGSDSTTMANLVSATAALECAEIGHVIHGFVIKNGTNMDVFVGSALIDMYTKCKLPEMAETIFSVMPHKNLVVWNSLTSCYNRNGLFDLSVSLLPQIIWHGLTPDSVSITNALVAVSSLSTLVKGKIVHGCRIRFNIQFDLQVENALIDMYIKCGCLKYAQRIFNNLSQKSTVTWNSMIAGYGSHGDCLKAIELFNQMQGSEDVLPDDITFLALISACSHSGFLAEGLRLFHSMKVKYKLEPRMEHYASMVDLWGRAGYLKEAYGFILRMPIKPDRSVLLCLLGACRVHGHIDMGELVADQLLKMEPTSGSNYVQLLNFYGEGELWDKAVDVRMSMKERGLKKNPGCSWIEIKERVSVFVSGDTSSPWTLEIYETLNDLCRNMEAETREFFAQ